MPLIVCPKTRFALTKRQTSGRLSQAQLRRLERKADTPKLERDFSQYIDQMPPLYLRGSSDRRVEGDPAYLISSKPVKWIDSWLLPPEATRPPLFFKRLLATVDDVSAMGLSHLSFDPGAEELVLTIDRAKVREAKSGIGIKHPRLTFHGYTFPAALRNFNLIGQLRYRREAFGYYLERDKTAGPLRFQKLQISAFIYRDTLRLLVGLAEAGWKV